MANNTARTKGARRRTPVRKTVGVKRSGRKPDPRYWKRALEHYLILEGLSPQEAKELVAISAA